MFASISTIQPSIDDSEKLSLLHHPPKQLPYKRWIKFSCIFLLAFAVSSITLYSLRYCSTHQCMMYRPSRTDGITVVPSIGLHLDSFHLLFALVYAFLLAVTIALRGKTHWYVMPLLVFVGFQFSVSTYNLLLDGNGYILEQLDDSWQRAYESEQDAILLEQLQTRLQCQGFSDRLDRNIFLSSQQNNTNDDIIEPCLGRLISLFGQGIYAWGIALWVLKLIQMIGLLGCYSIYLRMDQQTNDIEGGPTVHEKNKCAT
ncbi:hypothetical protein BDA99DRAFT_506318 [Phascolomyces articulosus]|uniref:Uncharacterized protein n=1 Tax=Phascolomyces articulosus TaxID=60185 RepID=A0AAD5K2R8_9FUNG|nr:hypothetical protein BDA99DRAFT_506318 [Phascolomyces articulosus]